MTGCRMWVAAARCARALRRRAATLWHGGARPWRRTRARCAGVPAVVLRPVPLRLRRLVRRAVRPALWAAGAGLVCVLAVNHHVITSTAAQRYEAAADVPSRQAAIVPGALVFRDGRPSDILADRLETALELYRSGKVRKILVSGDHGRTEYDEANAMRRWLASRGVPAADVFMDHAGFDTCDTMLRARKVFRVDSAVVVTQTFHLPRAVYAARCAGIDAVGLKADRHRYCKQALNELRETLARAKSFAELHLGVDPKFLGPEIPIEGDGRATWDEAARSDAAPPSRG